MSQAQLKAIGGHRHLLDAIDEVREMVVAGEAQAVVFCVVRRDGDSSARWGFADDSLHGGSLAIAALAQLQFQLMESKTGGEE